jgi:hypothetical protein
MMSFSFPWFYINSVTFEENRNESEFYFIHHFLAEDKEKSMHIDLIQPLINRIQTKEMIRIKANLYPNVNKSIENLDHVDYDFPHVSAVYSINTNNGGTIISIEGKEVLVPSIENQIVIFDGSLYHRSKYCTDEKIRVNINLNFK